MKLAQLLSVFPQLRWGDFAERDVRGLTQDSRLVKQGYVYVAIRGTSIDGHNFLSQVCSSGAIALVVEDDQQVPSDFRGAIVKVPSSRIALDQLASHYYGNPAQQLFCIGVTGTNGKTTVTYMVEKILSDFGWPTGVLGTIDHHLKEHRWQSQLTTPDALTLHRRLSEFVALGGRAAAFEVSSHALAQSRVESIPFSVGVFTSFSRDHLDYHHTMDEYFSAKERLFIDLLGRSQTRVAILNGDDEWIRRVRVKEGVTTWWYGQKDSDFVFKIMRQDLNGTLFHLVSPRGSTEVRLPCPGLHNVYNAVAAIAVGLAAGASVESAGVALSTFYGAPGRLEKVANDRGVHIFVDYAHTDDALRAVLRALAEVRAKSQASGKIITVFGCGGDRDAGKRPMMAKAACEASDQVIITSDNPRSEDPLKIISQIQTGVPKDWQGRLQVEPDRRAALELSLRSAQKGDVILVAGKGHEDYQIIGEEKLNFSDVLVLRELLESMGSVL